MSALIFSARLKKVLSDSSNCFIAQIAKIAQAQAHRPQHQMGHFAYIVCWLTSPNGGQRRIGFSSYIKITNTIPRYRQGFSHCHLRIYR